MAVNFLQTKVRPGVVFDVTNRKHRELVAKFIRTRSWTHSPYQFIANEPTQNDIGTMMRQMVEFYAEKDFGKKDSKKG